MLQKLLFCSQARLSLTAALVCALSLFFPPLFWAEGPQAGSESPPPPLSASPAPASAAPSPMPGSGLDAARSVRVLLADGTVEEQSMAQYLWSVVAAEMPASFQPEALRAQAVCARTYTAWMTLHPAKHQQADICTDSSCCQAYTPRETALTRWGRLGEEYSQKISDAVADTDGMIAAYESAPIQALFFSSAAGATEDAAAVWGRSLPYLTSVASPEGDEVPNYHTAVTLSAQEVEDLVTAAYPEADLSGPPGGWFGQPAVTASGRVASLTVGGLTLSGGAARTLFSLRSAYFQIEEAEGVFTFSVTGYGHGVGLSQYGANAMARAGSGWRDIVQHYYSGVTLQQGW